MSVLFWKNTQDAYTEADTKRGLGRRGEVSEQHPLPIQLAWRQEGVEEWTVADDAHPLPVNIAGTATTTVKLTKVLTTIEGIGVAAAYATADAFGGRLVIPVPVEGTICTVVFHDYDDEGITKELVLFNDEFTATADNSAFAVSDADMRNCVGVISIVTYFNFGSNQIGQATPALFYIAPKGLLYGQFVTRGTDNIAAGAIPDFTMVVA